MGQRCCSPAMRLDPKHTYLLTLIYTETQQNIKDLNYDAINQFLMKKGYLKTLCDYLSSHLNQISPSITYCKNIHIAMRNKSPTVLLFLGVITSEIIHKIANAGLRNPDIQNKRSQYDKSQAITSVKMAGKYKKSTIKREKMNKYEQLSPIDQQVYLNILDIQNQIIKQTIYSRTQLKTQKTSNQRFQLIQFNILQTIQNTLAKIMEQDNKFFKVNHTVIKQVLDNLILILMMCCHQKKQNQTSTGIKMKISINVSPIKNPIKPSKDQNQFQLNKNLKAIPNPPNAIDIFLIEQNQVRKLRSQCLSNYYLLFQSTNLRLSNATLYQDIVRQHMPRFLQLWADLILSNDLNRNKKNQNERLASQGQQVRQLTSQMDSEENKQKRQNYQINQLIQKIMLQFFNTYFSSRQPQDIYKELMIIYDRLNFNRSRITLVQKLFFVSLKNYQLRRSVMSKWFDFILNYLGNLTIPSGQNNSVSSVYFSEIFGQQKKFQNIPIKSIQDSYLNQINLQINFGNQKYEYINWHKQQNIIGCLKTIYKWIENEEISIEDIISFKRKKLLTAILCNLAWGSPKINEQIYKLIQYLIQCDIRFFGYLLEITIFIIEKMKIPQMHIKSQSNLQKYLNDWKQTTLQRKQTQSVDETLNYLGFKSIFNKSKFKKTLHQNIQLIPIDQFVHEIISAACYPYLKQLKDNNKLILPLIKSHPMKNENENQLMNQQKQNNLSSHPIKHSQNIKTSISVRNQKRGSEKDTEQLSYQIQNGQIYKSSNNFKNSSQYFHLTVFQQTMQILFKDVEILNYKANNKYYIKLIGLFLASNLNIMGYIIQQINEKQQFIYYHSIAKKMNKFLAKFHRAIKLLSSSSDQMFENKSQLQIDSCLQIGNKQNYFDKSSKSVEKDKYLRNIFNYIHVWIYPSLCYLLKDQSYLEDLSGMKKSLASTKNYKILIQVCIKVFFKNMVMLAKNRLQEYYVGKQRLFKDQIKQQQSVSSDSIKIDIFSIKNSFVSNQQASQPSNPANKLLKQKQRLSLDQFEVQKNMLQSYFLVIQEIYEIFIQFYKNYLTKPSKVINQKQPQITKSTKAVLQDNLKITKRKIASQIQIQKQNKNKNKHKNLQNQRNSFQFDQFIMNLTNNYKLIKSFKVIKNQKSDSFALKSTTLTNSNFVGSKNNLQVNPQGLQDCIKKSAQIIKDQRLCVYMFSFIDKISQEKIKKQNIANSDIQMIVNKYILKSYSNNQNIIIENAEQQHNCQLFRKAKNKVSKLFTANNDQLQENQFKQTKNTHSKSGIRDKKYYDMLDQIEYNQNKNINLAKIIEEFQLKYSLIAQNQQTPKNNSRNKRKNNFTLIQNQIQIQQSNKQSSKISHISEAPSFCQILSEIKKH